MQRLVPVVLVVLMFVLAGPQEAASTEPSPKAPIPGGPNDNTALWWDDSGKVKALSLTDEQRKKMREHLNAYREKVPREGRAPAFHEALVQGNWKNARSESEKMAKLAEASVRMRVDLKIDALSLLSKEQLQLLVDKYPRLIYKPWKRAKQGASPP